MNRWKSLFFAWIFPWVPKRLLSRSTGVLMRVPLPSFTREVLLRWFAWFFAIDAALAEKPLLEYGSFNEFFTRRLRSGLRSVKGSWIHPVDGTLSMGGPMQADELLQAKGWTYSLGEFLGSDSEAQRYLDGQFATYYLCPSDYHRVHVPVAGQLLSARHIPGLLWPVNAWSVANIQRLFCLNERVVMHFSSPHGPYALVMVGATNVGNMSITPDPSIVTNRWLWHAPTDRQYEPPIAARVGEEIGIFHLGSTVICVFSKGFPSINWPPGAPVKMGEAVTT